MRTAIITDILAAGILLTGCGPRGDSAGSPNSSPSLFTNTSLPNAMSPLKATISTEPLHVVAIPVLQPIIAAWQEGNKSAAIKRFQEADWAGRPILAAGMVVNFSEAQFKTLSDGDQQMKARELTAQLDLLKQLVEAVSQAGRDAAAKGDIVQARKSFTSLNNFGLALDTPDHLRLVQVLGKVSKNIAKNGLAKLVP